MNGKTIKSKLLTPEPVQYKKIECDIELKTSWKNQYNYADVALDMLIKTPSGEDLVLPCYYVKGASGKLSEWKARFTPRETGNYSYRFRLIKSGKTSEESGIDSFKTVAAAGRGFLKKNNDWSFGFDNGEIFRGIGENICWESRNGDDSKYFKELHENPKFNYETMLRKLSSSGGNYFRTWMCQWNLPLEWKKVIHTNRYTGTKEYFNPSAFPKMDRLVELCDSLGVYMMLTIDYHGALLGNGWANNSYNVLNGGFAKTPTEFFSNPKSKNQFKNRLRYLVARWGYSPSIGSWEFFNEIDNAIFAGQPTPQIDPKLVVQWHTEMSNYLKIIDPYKHLITTSVSHRDIEGLNTIPDIDFNQKHIYVYIEAIPGALLTYSGKFNKPYVIGEFANQWDWSLDFNKYASDFDFDFKRGLWYGLFSPTPILPMTWWWEFFDSRNMMPYYSKVKKISDKMIDAGKGDFKILDILLNNKEEKAFGVKCGDKIFVYLNNKADSSSVYSIMINEQFRENSKVIVYHPDKDEFAENELIAEKGEFGITIHKITIPKREDIILVIQ